MYNTPWYLGTMAIMIFFIWLNISGLWEFLFDQEKIKIGKELCITEKEFYYSNFLWCESYNVRYNITNTEIKS